MLKLILSLTQIIIGIYWAGDAARQNPKINAFVEQLELGYGEFNQRIRSTQIAKGLSALKKIYGWLSILSFGAFVFAGKFIEPTQNIGLILSMSFFFSFFGWFSLKWCTEHRKAINEYGPMTAFIVFSPLLMSAFDSLAGTPFTKILSEPFYSFPLPAGLELPHFNDPIAIGAVASLLLAAFFAFYYAITWIISAPAAFLSVSIIALPVAMARFIHVIAPRKAFFGLTVVIFTLATLLQL